MITLIDTAPSYATKSAAKTEKKAEASTEKKTVATKTITKKKAAPKASK
jgi:hypothetical protein